MGEFLEPGAPPPPTPAGPTRPLQAQPDPCMLSGYLWSEEDLTFAPILAGAGPSQTTEQASEGGGRWPLSLRHRLH